MANQAASTPWPERRRRISEVFRLQVLLVITASVIPTAVLLIVSYFQTIASAKANLQDIINSAALKTENLLAAAESILRRNNIDLQDADAETAAKVLRRQVYNDYRFRETGIINKEGLLFLASLGSVDPPKPISASLAHTNFDPGKPDLQILGTGRTQIMQEESIIMMLKGSGKIGSLYMLIDPILLTDFLKLIAELDLGPNGFIAFVSEDNRLLSSIGASKEEILSSLKDPPSDAIVTTQTTKDGNIKIIAETQRDWVLRFWREELLISAPITTAVSMLLGGLFIRELRKSNSLDYELRRGLARGEFEIHYQPIINLETRKCVGAEALIRWHHPQRGLIYPGVFIPIAEQTGLIGPMTEWLLEQSLKDQSVLTEKFPDLYTSINLSPSQLNTGSVNRIVEILKGASEHARSLITFEITENKVVEEHWDVVQDAIAQLKRCGVKLAIDDFGMGYSNIAYLQRLDVDQLKLDKIFIQGLNDSNDMAQLADSLIDLGSRFQLVIVAEGIEREVQYTYLRNRGVPFGQGWLFSRALPLEDYGRFLQEQTT